MKKLVRLKRRSAVLGVLAVLLLAAVVLRPSETSTQRTEDLPALFDGFAGANATSIELKQGGSLITGGKPRVVKLERQERRDGGTAWVVSSAFDYPAGETQVARLLSELSQARVVTETTRRAEAFEQYVQDGSWVDVTLKDAGGTTLAALGVGTERDGETHLRLDTPAPSRVVRVRNFHATSARAMPESWFESRMFPDMESRNIEALEILQKIEVDGQPSTRKLAFTRRPQEAAKEGEPPPERGWDMTSPEAGPASRVDVDDLARALVGLLFQDVVARPDAGDGDPKFGFAAPEVVATATFAATEPGKPGKRIQLTLGALDPESKLWYARRGGAPWVFSVRDDEYSAGRLRNDPSKYKETPKPTEAPKDAPPEAPKDGAGGIGDPDGGTGPGGVKPPEPAPAPEAPKPPEPAPAPETPRPPEPAPETPKPPEPAPASPR